MTVLALLAIVLALWITSAVRCRFFPAPVPWSSEDEEAAEAVSLHLGVTLEDARLAVLAWRA